MGAIASGAVNLVLQKRQFAHEKDMHSLQNQAREHVKALLEEMLSHEKFVDRSYHAMRNKVGGFSDDELRQLLHEVGAKKSSRNQGLEEWWYLTAREQEHIENLKKWTAD